MTIEGYAYPPSVAQGDSVGVYVSTDASLFTIKFIRVGSPLVLYKTVVDIPGAMQSVPDSVWAVGCGWNPSYMLGIPDTWPSGVYEARFFVAGTLRSYAVFTVRENQPGSTSSILFQNSITTWQAYNYWGGKSLYDGPSTEGERSHVVSFERPYIQAGGLGGFASLEYYFILWLEAAGYTVEYCTSLDTHADPALEDHYALFLSVGHDEYWSREMRDNIEDRIASGRNVAFFSGNTCWWQIRISPDLRTMTCYKDKALDPLTGITDSLVTVNWFADPVYRPENTMTGVSFRNGGYVNHDGWYPDSLGYGGYTVERASHWIYQWTYLGDGDEFGREQAIVGYETDGADVTIENGLHAVTGLDGTPLSYLVLGTSPASRGTATMGIYVQGGTVFNCATTDWSLGLAEDPVVAQITKNVLDGLAHGSPTGIGEGEPGPRSGLVRLRLLQNPAPREINLEWEGRLGASASLQVFTANGRLVARVPAPSGREDGTVGWDGRDVAGQRVPTGLYYLLLKGSTGSASAKVLVLNP